MCRVVLESPTADGQGYMTRFSKHMGPDDILVKMDLNLKGGLTTAHVEDAIDRIEDEIRKAVPQARRIFIECETLRRARQTPGVQTE